MRLLEGSPLDFNEQSAANVLRMSVRKLRRERVAGRIGFYRVAGRIWYSEAQLLEYVERARQFRRATVGQP